MFNHWLFENKEKQNLDNKISIYVRIQINYIKKLNHALVNL